MKRLRAIDKWSLGLTVKELSVDEQSYLYSRIQDTRSRMCDIFAGVSIAFLLILQVLRNTYTINSALGVICRYSYAVCVIWVGLLFFAKSSEAKQRWQSLGSTLTSVLCSWVIVDLLKNGIYRDRVHNVFVISYAIVVGTFVILMAWVDRSYLMLVALVSIVFSWNLPNVIEGAPNRYVACIFIAFLPLLNHATHLRLVQTEIREMRVRLSTMPRRMALSLADFAQEPRERFCICLCSDWRGYQDLVSGLSDEKVVHLLEDYYMRVQDLLGKELGEYDYYMDWIADELFVVVYSQQTDSVDLVARQKMAGAVVDLSQELLRMKREFSDDHSLGLSADIGLSCGRSLIGVIGPSNHRKATALGSNPGRARRMQGCGKLMRNEISDQDRIIFGDEMLIVLQAPAESNLVVNQFDSSKRRLRNLEDQQLFYVIPVDETANLDYLKIS